MDPYVMKWWPSVSKIDWKILAAPSVGEQRISTRSRKKSRCLNSKTWTLQINTFGIEAKLVFPNTMIFKCLQTCILMRVFSARSLWEVMGSNQGRHCPFMHVMDCSEIKKELFFVCKDRRDVWNCRWEKTQFFKKSKLGRKVLPGLKIKIARNGFQQVSIIGRK